MNPIKSFLLFRTMRPVYGGVLSLPLSALTSIRSARVGIQTAACSLYATLRLCALARSARGPYSESVGRAVTGPRGRRTRAPHRNRIAARPGGLSLTRSAGRLEAAAPAARLPKVSAEL